MSIEPQPARTPCSPPPAVPPTATATTTLDIYTHMFEDTRHAHDIRTRMAASPFAGLLEPRQTAADTTVLELF
jgi:hypothetical protein